MGNVWLMCVVLFVANAIVNVFADNMPAAVNAGACAYFNLVLHMYKPK